MNKPLNLREAMPETAKFIDSLREVFGAEGINQNIKGGMNGVPTFWASENGHEIGTRYVPGIEISVAQMVIESQPMEGTNANRKPTHR